MNLHAIGVNHNQHPVSEVSFEPLDNDVITLSTCNRTEVYYYGKDGKYSDLYDDRHFPSFRYKGRVAARHVIEVACGIKSVVLGDRHVFHQMKEAYKNSNPKEPIHRLMELAFQAAKRVQVKGSVPKAAVARAGKINSALVVGAGQIGADVATRLSIPDLRVCNRTQARANKLPGETVKWKDRHSQDVDTAFVTTGASEPVFDSEKSKADMVFDLSNPPNVKGKAIRIENLETNRSDNLPRAKKICRFKTEDFMKWMRFYKNKKPIIKSLNEAFSEVRSEEIDKHYKDPMSREDVEELICSIQEKFIAIPAEKLRKGTAENLTDAFTGA
jgi:glutamyl-tRNA reductase